MCALCGASLLKTLNLHHSDLGSKGFQGIFKQSLIGLKSVFKQSSRSLQVQAVFKRSSGQYRQSSCTIYNGEKQNWPTLFCLAITPFNIMLGLKVRGVSKVQEILSLMGTEICQF